MIPKIRMGSVLNKLASKKPKMIPRRANNIEVPANVNATGYPASRAMQIIAINRMGIISIIYEAPLIPQMPKLLEIRKLNSFEDKQTLALLAQSRFPLPTKKLTQNQLSNKQALQWLEKEKILSLRY